MNLVNYALENKQHCVYIFEVVGPSRITFLFRDRYSSIELTQKTIRERLAKDKGIKFPKFPSKQPSQIFSQLSQKDSFYKQRGQKLATFLNEFLAIPQVAAHRLVLAYFLNQAADEISKERIV